MNEYKAFISGYSGKVQYNLTKSIQAETYKDALIEANKAMTNDTETIVVKRVNIY